LNPDELSFSEVEGLRKIEFCLKLHDDVALKLELPTLVAENMRVVHSSTNTSRQDPVHELKTF